MNNMREKIVKDFLVRKFCAYGFLKNLKFFEPYLIIYLLGIGQSLFSIGVLYAIREGITYLFEIPSGVIADNYGRKKELMSCFVFYIISFFLFFAGTNFFVLVLAMIFFGLGEAFRSGTHKAMIYSYLEKKGWFSEKTFVYGRTRSFSLAGSSISSFLSILFVLNLPAMKWIFVICTIPYLLDFILIWTYPDYLDERSSSIFTFKGFLQIIVKSIREISQRPILRKILLSSSIFDGLFRAIKDYIQPIMAILVLSTLVNGAAADGSEDLLKISLGVIYGIFYIFSAFASRNAFRLHRIARSARLMNFSFALLGVAFLLLSLTIAAEWTVLVTIVYFVLYVMKDARRPIFVDISGDWMNREERATVMSLDSQLRSLVTIIAAPMAGLMADMFSIPVMFLVFGILILLTSKTVYITEPYGR